ncbi:MAG: hypothetical protein AAF721_05575 [Myxococcota bacterium]
MTLGVALRTVTLAIVGASPPMGCAQDLARASSGAIGCPHERIEVSEISVGWSQMSWRARCDGMDFLCSGETDPSCSPEGLHTAPDTLEPPAPAPATSVPSSASTTKATKDGPSAPPERPVAPAPAKPASPTTEPDDAAATPDTRLPDEAITPPSSPSAAAPSAAEAPGPQPRSDP